MRVSRPTTVGMFLALVVSGLATPAAAGPPPPDPIGDARDWLVAQQQEDGGFELADFPGFETPDAVLALATAAQTTGAWSEAEALAAVQAVAHGTSGKTALNWADDFVDGGVSAGLEAKVALLVALPLGLDPGKFDPDGDGATDLTDSLGSIDLALFNSFLVARTVESVVGRNVHQDDLQRVCEAQHADGGWSFDGVSDTRGGTAPDGVDTAGAAVMALTAAGVGVADPVITAAVTYFQAGQQPTGAWQPADFGFGTPDDPNSTVLAVQGLLAAGVAPGSLAADPGAFIESRQILDPGPDFGRIVSPNDGFGVNTFATSQSVQGLAAVDGLPGFLPVGAATKGRVCLPPHGFADVPARAWNDDAVRWLALFDVARGYAGGEFRPADVFNRAQASMWFDALFPDTVGGPHPFSDVADGAWFEPGADFVGDPTWPGGPIARGFPPDTEFRGTAPFNRAQAITWMYNAAGRPSIAGCGPHGFVDADPWFDTALTWAGCHGIVNGFGDEFRGYDQVNRAQGAFWFYNLAASPSAWGPAVTLPSTIVHTPAPPP